MENNKQEEIGVIKRIESKHFPLNHITEEVISVKESWNFLTDLRGREKVFTCEEVRVREG